jgi:S1-C subfamily serine protease
MLRAVIAFWCAFFLAGLPGRADDTKKSDQDTKVPEGMEFKLTPVEVVVAEKPIDGRRYEATIKAAKESKAVKMPKESWSLGFYPKVVKGGGVEVANSIEGTGMRKMRTESGQDKDEGAWQADPGDIITHVNGYAVNNVEELICAVSLAKNKDDVQIVLKDVDTGKLTVFYVTATKR